ncbi:MAG: ANTAR domain-containing protein [Sedimenticola sp.]
MDMDKRLLRSLRNKKIAVIHPRDEDGENLLRQLQRIGCQVSSIWPSPKELPDDLDAVFFLIDQEKNQGCEWLDNERALALIAVISYENPTVLEALTAAKVHGLITKPVRPFGVLARLVTALSLFKYEERLNTRIAKLDETLKTRRLVEQATRILSRTREISEDEAYALIRREAMNKQITLFDMARSIINADTFLSPDLE